MRRPGTSRGASTISCRRAATSRCARWAPTSARRSSDARYRRYQWRQRGQPHGRQHRDRRSAKIKIADVAYAKPATNSAPLSVASENVSFGTDCLGALTAAHDLAQRRLGDVTERDGRRRAVASTSSSADVVEVARRRCMFCQKRRPHLLGRDQARDGRTRVRQDQRARGHRLRRRQGRGALRPRRARRSARAGSPRSAQASWRA